MDVSDLLSREPSPRLNRPPSGAPSSHTHVHQYPTRHAVASQGQQLVADGPTTPPFPAKAESTAAITPPSNGSPKNPDKGKTIYFARRYAGAQTLPRRPMAIVVHRRDSTEAVLEAVKATLDPYERLGLALEEENGDVLIARYENFYDGMTVYVRTVANSASPYGATPSTSVSVSPPVASNAHLAEDGTCSTHPAQAVGRSASRPSSRVARKRTTSPAAGRTSRNAPIAPGKGRASSIREASLDSYNGVDGADGARRARSDHHGRADISVENIVEGGRRKRAKFESSELPLFMPPHVQALPSASSTSPADRPFRVLAPSVFPPIDRPGISHAPPFDTLSTMRYGIADFGQRHAFEPGSSLELLADQSRRESYLRDRPRPSQPLAHQSGVATTVPPPGQPAAILTPEPTTASCISDEDAALQLMRLGDASNLSSGTTRLSATTIDDGGDDRSVGTEPKAHTYQTARPQQRNPVGWTSLPMPLPPSTAAKVHQVNPVENLPGSDSTDPSSDPSTDDVATTDNYKKEEYAAGEDDVAARHDFAGLDSAETAATVEYDAAPPPSPPRPPPPAKVTKSGLDAKRGGRSVAASQNPPKSRAGQATAGKGRVSKSRASTTTKVKPKAVLAMHDALVQPQAPISPAATVPSHSRKTSTASTINFQHTLAADEEDLSSKPRCQRCRTSKKGCDRMRPCGRCKDGGIGIDGCISEDEANGRKGRYGRHMGVTVKKDGRAPVSPVDVAPGSAAAGGLGFSPPAAAASHGATGAVEKGKKRKR